MTPTTQIVGAAVLILVESNIDNENLWTTAHLDGLANTAEEYMENQGNDLTVSPILLFRDEAWHPGLLILTSNPSPQTNTTVSPNTTDLLPSSDNLSSTSMNTPDPDSSLIYLDNSVTPTDLEAYCATLGLSLDSTDHYADPDDLHPSPSDDDVMTLTELKTYLFSPNFFQMERELNEKEMQEFDEWICRGSNPIENKKVGAGTMRSFLELIAITVLDIIIERLMRLRSELVK